MPRKLGQHYLLRGSVLERIAVAACPEPPEPLVIEIGPGKGPLTEKLLQRADRVIAIEVDAWLVEHLGGRFPDESRLTVVPADVLQTDLGQWGTCVVAGNLPYYITSPILEQVLALGPLCHRAVFLVQREVAERLAAGPGTRDYGYLSAITQVQAEVEYLSTVPRAAFSPVPNVDSALVRLRMRSQPLAPDLAGFRRFASACFRQKRKTLRNNLQGVFGPERLATAPTELALRAEQMSPTDLVALYERLRAT